MRQNTRVTFATRDLDRLKSIQTVVDGDLKPHRAVDASGGIHARSVSGI
jgi:hypothetical protein